MINVLLSDFLLAVDLLLRFSTDILERDQKIDVLEKSNALKLVDKLQSDSFGDWRDARSIFPIPLPAKEAGPSPSGQRRYLWTDSFGILNFISQAKLVRQIEVDNMIDDVSVESKDSSEIEAEQYLHAAKELIISVFNCLGNPRSEEYPMAPGSDNSNHHDHTVINYKGLRIGKVNARQGDIDIGSAYDGMYWHYLDKFIFAVTRYIIETDDEVMLKRVVKLIKQIHPAFLVPGKGYYRKLNVDLSHTADEPENRQNYDVLSTVWIYKNINQLCNSN